MRVYATIPSNMKGTILMEVEAPYADNGTLGLGADYQYDTPPKSQYDTTKQWKDWAADSYSEEAKVNDKVQEKTYTITTSTDNNGSLKVEVGGQEGKTTGIKKGEQVKITPQPNPGYELDGITINGYDEYNPNLSVYSFKMPEGNVNVVATFKKIPAYNITIDSNIQNGKVISNKPSAVSGEEFILTINPDPGYKLANLSINGWNYTNRVVGNEAKLNMGTQNLNVTATFERDPNYVMISFNPNGGSGTMKSDFARLGEKNYTMPQNRFTPPTGKIFKNWRYSWGYNYYRDYNPGDVVTVSADVTFYPVELVLWQTKLLKKARLMYCLLVDLQLQPTKNLRLGK